MADMSGATTKSLDQVTERQTDLSAMIAGAIAELDLRQIEITRRLTPAQRCQEGLSMIRLAEQVGAYRFTRHVLSPQAHLPVLVAGLDLGLALGQEVAQHGQRRVALVQDVPIPDEPQRPPIFRPILS